jgi:hypothetical protein
MPYEGKIGGSLAGRIELSPARRKRQDAGRRRQVERWSAKASPVTIVQAVRCDCGEWMRPGVDHTCEANG